jgi:hypothetical protein
MLPKPSLSLPITVLSMVGALLPCLNPETPFDDRFREVRRSSRLKTDV